MIEKVIEKAVLTGIQRFILENIHGGEPWNLSSEGTFFHTTWKKSANLLVDKGVLKTNKTILEANKNHSFELTEFGERLAEQMFGKINGEENNDVSKGTKS